MEKGRNPGGSAEIDLEEVTKLVHALESDLAQVRKGSRDVQLLRDEVETLKNVLNSPIRRHHWVREGLHALRKAFEEGLEAVAADGLKASQYIAEIGRILGM
jgi:predicted  nucleic acid-binding Zn-ribbon protein